MRVLLGAGVALVALVMAQPAMASPHYEGPVVDVHLHAAAADTNGPAPNAICIGPAANLRYDPKTPWAEAMGAQMAKPPCEKPLIGPATDDEVMDQTIAAMRKYNARGVLGSHSESFARWSARAPGMFVAGREASIGGKGETPEQLVAAYKAGDFAVLGELGAQYGGLLADDPKFEPYWQAAEENDIPVGIHLGMGPPGSPALFGKYRLQSPMRLQEVLAKHPRLRVFAMHAGYPFVDDLKAMLYAFPQLHVDTGVLQMAIPRAEYYAFLEELVRAGYVDRIMFGSDQMNWPGMIGEGIDAINDAPFLTYEQKKAILHDNAARFLRIGELP